MDNKEFPDSYISDNLPLSQSMPDWKKEVLKMVYGTDISTQPLCENCGRPLYYELNVRTGKIELEKCKICGGKNETCK